MKQTMMSNLPAAGARKAPRVGDGVLAPERHVVHAAQDAAVRRLSEQDRAKVTSDRTKAA